MLNRRRARIIDCLESMLKQAGDANYLFLKNKQQNILLPQTFSFFMLSFISFAELRGEGGLLAAEPVVPLRALAPHPIPASCVGW